LGRALSSEIGLYVADAYDGIGQFLDRHAEDTRERALMALGRSVDAALPPRYGALGDTKAGRNSRQREGSRRCLRPLHPDFAKACHADSVPRRPGELRS